MFYFRLFFRCENCLKISTRVIKLNTRSKFDARERIGPIGCHQCTNPSELTFLEIEELDLAHLEEFIRWSSNESKLINESHPTVAHQSSK